MSLADLLGIAAGAGLLGGLTFDLYRFTRRMRRG